MLLVEKNLRESFGTMRDLKNVLNIFENILVGMLRPWEVSVCYRSNFEDFVHLGPFSDMI